MIFFLKDHELVLLKRCTVCGINSAIYLIGVISLSKKEKKKYNNSNVFIF